MLGLTGSAWNLPLQHLPVLVHEPDVGLLLSIEKRETFDDALLERLKSLLEGLDFARASFGALLRLDVETFEVLADLGMNAVLHRAPQNEASESFWQGICSYLKATASRIFL